MWREGARGEMCRSNELFARMANGITSFQRIAYFNCYYFMRFSHFAASKGHRFRYAYATIASHCYFYVIVSGLRTIFHPTKRTEMNAPLVLSFYHNIIRPINRYGKIADLTKCYRYIVSYTR